MMLIMAGTHGACGKIKLFLESYQLHPQPLQCRFLQVLTQGIDSSPSSVK